MFFVVRPSVVPRTGSPTVAVIVVVAFAAAAAVSVVATAAVVYGKVGRCPLLARCLRI